MYTVQCAVIVMNVKATELPKTRLHQSHIADIKAMQNYHLAHVMHKMNEANKDERERGRERRR